ncbi:MAG: hypothetical protein HYY50_00870 [Candidatus Kerfeldbacteria bacterium]|nr:hypothetical protein [Candidatus Kerfeldbacteria bacterium]
MESKNWSQFLRRLQSVRLTDAESASLRHKLERLVRGESIDRHGWRRWKTILIPHRLQLMPILSVIIAAAVVVSSGVAAAAESARPGDPLYQWKVGVNEEVRAAFSFSSEARANWDMRRLERRLEEAEALAASGRLDATAQAAIEASFKHGEMKIRALIDRMAADGHEQAARLSSNLEATLHAHQSILTRLSATATSAAEQGGTASISIVTTVESAAAAAAEVRIKHEAAVASARPNLEAAATRRLKAANHKIAEVEKFIAKWEDRLGTEVVAEAKVKLESAKDLVAEGQAKLEADEFAEAFRLFQRAHMLAQEAKLLVRVRQALNINISVKLNANASPRPNVNITPPSIHRPRPLPIPRPQRPQPPESIISNTNMRIQSLFDLTAP